MVDSGSPLSAASRDSATSPPSSAISSRIRNARSRDCTPPSPAPLTAAISPHSRRPPGRPGGSRRLDPTRHRGYVFHLTDGTFHVVEVLRAADARPWPDDGTAVNDSRGER